MAISERKRLTFTAIAVVLVGIVTGLLLGGALLPSQAAGQQYNERTTTTTTVTNVVHTHDGSRHTHTTTTVVTTTETTPHYTFHQPTTAIAQPGTTTTATAPVLAFNEVIIFGRAYMPSSITVPVGTTVTWTNPDAEEHTVTSNIGGLFDNYLLGGDSFSYTFNEPGTFTYSCMPHPEMLGRVIVE